MRLRNLVLLAGTLGLAGCPPLFSVDTDIPDMCVTYSNVEVQGVVAGDAIAKSFSYDKLDIFNGFFELDAKIATARATLHAVDGVADFSFLQSIDVEVQSGTRAPLIINACDEGSCASDSPDTELEAFVPDNTLDYFRSGPVDVTITLRGNLPRETWHTDVTVCVSGSASLSLSL